MSLLLFPYQTFLKEMGTHGAYSVPILPEERLKQLLAEAQTYATIAKPSLMTSNKVRQELSTVVVSPQGEFGKLHHDFMRMMHVIIPRYTWRKLFPLELAFNELSLQFYKRETIGITPHYDGNSRRNLICVFILEGRADFALCDNREGENPRYLDTTPGNVIILRGNGLLGANVQPFHFLTNVRDDRTVFRLCQKS